MTTKDRIAQKSRKESIVIGKSNSRVYRNCVFFFYRTLQEDDRQDDNEDDDDEDNFDSDLGHSSKQNITVSKFRKNMKQDDLRHLLQKGQNKNRKQVENNVTITTPTENVFLSLKCHRGERDLAEEKVIVSALEENVFVSLKGRKSEGNIVEDNVTVTAPQESIDELESELYRPKNKFEEPVSEAYKPTTETYPLSDESYKSSNDTKLYKPTDDTDKKELLETSILDSIDEVVSLHADDDDDFLMESDEEDDSTSPKKFASERYFCLLCFSIFF